MILIIRKMMVPQCWKNNEDSFYKMQKTCESAMTYFDAIGDPEDLFEYCLCYKNIILQTTFCDQPTCLSRELRASLLQLKMRHADMKRTQNLSSIFSPVRFLALIFIKLKFEHQYQVHFIPRNSRYHMMNSHKMKSHCHISLTSKRSKYSVYITRDKSDIYILFC